MLGITGISQESTHMTIRPTYRILFGANHSHDLVSNNTALLVKNLAKKIA
jgi:hypothetical protein